MLAIAQIRGEDMQIDFDAEMPFIGPVTAFVEGRADICWDHVNDDWYIGDIYLDTNAAPEAEGVESAYKLPENTPEHKWLLEYLSDDYSDAIEEVIREELASGPEYDKYAPAQLCL
jgi:hypothetical protein